MKITRQQLRRLIKEAISSPDWFTLNDDNQQWGHGEKEIAHPDWDEKDPMRRAFGPSQAYRTKVATALVKNAIFLKEQGVPGDHKVGIIKDEGGDFLPEVFGTNDDVVANARSVDWFERAIHSRAWHESYVHNIQVQLFDDDVLDSLHGVTQEDTPFYSLGRVRWP